MGEINFLTTPILLLVLYGFAYAIRQSVTNRETAKYFIPALSAKFLGAISLGLIYQFYYQGGDTIMSYHSGANQIWSAFLDSPSLAVKLILAGSDFENSTFQYATKIISYGDLPTYFVVRVAGIFSLFTFNSYYANALLFASMSFSGSWAMYIAVYRLYPHLSRKLAVVVLFVPSIVFWGSGILKDTITFAAVGWFLYAFVNIFLLNQRKLVSVVILLLSIAVITHIKIYIALCLFPSFIILLFIEHTSRIKNFIVKFLVAPFLFLISIILSFQSISYLGNINKLYSIDQFAYRAQVNAEWLAYVSRQQGGSVYSLGDDDDFTNSGLLNKFIPAVWVTLFRPYIWEVKNPVMLLSALENLTMLFFCFFLIYKVGFFISLKRALTEPIVFAFLCYSILFSFAIGVSTWNFGTLVRYKIPMLPFFLIALIVLEDIGKKLRYANNN